MTLDERILVRNKMRMRKILLIEPNYHNKYPPIGLMKIATYHRLIKDHVKFFKGDLNDLMINELINECVEKLINIDCKINWATYIFNIKQYILKKNTSILDNSIIRNSNNYPLIQECFNYYRRCYFQKDYKKNPIWDRIYVTTLFTFYWKSTINTINEAKSLVKDIGELKVGGVLASLMPIDVEHATGIKPHVGLLNKPGYLDKGNDYIIDDLPLDYSILSEIDYKYDIGSAYLTYMTKGCTRKCKFCAVQKLEPDYVPKIDTINKYNSIKQRYGDQQNLIIMDNNILESPKFQEIVDEIKQLGFKKGAKYSEPNQLDIAIRNLKNRFNEIAYIRKSYKLLMNLINRLHGDISIEYYKLLEENNLLTLETTTKENLLNVYPYIKHIYEKYRSKTIKLRYVDFNQGVDCRHIDDKKVSLISQLPIKPFRIAFDHINLKHKYINAIKLAYKYNINEISNYILYNYKDKPEELYYRLKINVDLNEELNVQIYSFPMKYVPLEGEESKDRSYIGQYWNKKYLRAINSILNVTKGIVAPGRSFFEKAFGNDISEFHQILYMPELYIIYRKIFEIDLGYTNVWREQYESLNNDDLKIAHQIIESNCFVNYYKQYYSEKINSLLLHYTINQTLISKSDPKHSKIKKEYNKLILRKTYKISPKKTIKIIV